MITYNLATCDYCTRYNSSSIFRKAYKSVTRDWHTDHCNPKIGCCREPLSYVESRTFPSASNYSLQKTLVEDLIAQQSQGGDYGSVTKFNSTIPGKSFPKGHFEGLVSLVEFETQARVCHKLKTTIPDFPLRDNRANRETICRNQQYLSLAKDKTHEFCHCNKCVLNGDVKQAYIDVFDEFRNYQPGTRFFKVKFPEVLCDYIQETFTCAELDSFIGPGNPLR